MAKRKRRTAKPAPKPAESEHRRFSRNAGIWLATLSTVVGVATGMFTLRDQVFPREAGTAVAVSVPEYQQDVGEVCEAVNDNDRARARGDKRIEQQLGRTEDIIPQRNALLDGVRRTAARSGDALASLAAIEAPPQLVAVHRTTEAAWNRNLARLREYALRLDGAGIRRDVAAAIEHLSTMRPALGRDGDRVRAGLKRLGGANCDLAQPIVTKTFTLPVPPDKGNEGKDGTKDKAVEDEDGNDDSGANIPPSTATPPPSTVPGGTGDPPPVANGASGGATSGANTPPPITAPPGANTPPASGGGGGGGGGDGRRRRRRRRVAQPPGGTSSVTARPPSRTQRQEETRWSSSASPVTCCGRRRSCAPPTRWPTRRDG